MADEVIYLAGPMTGKPDFNYPLFESTEKLLSAKGYKILSAHKSGATFETPYEECLKLGLIQLLKCNAITFLPMWWRSKGATFEALIAKILGYKFYELGDPSEPWMGTQWNPSIMKLAELFWNAWTGRQIKSISGEFV